jgi:predicted dehydrogenase
VIRSFRLSKKGGTEMTQPIGIGLVGAGAFGEFCLAAFSEMPEVRIAAVADLDAARAESLASKYDAAAYGSLDELLADPSVGIVALNTPPYLHETQGRAAIAAGKHLFCEKPLALTVGGGAALIEAAEARGVRLTVDYVMRRNPIWAAAAALRKSGVLGRLLHMSLTNHAAGLNLPEGHWFWDKAKSGGIWIEHGVHFFDAFAWVAGTNGEIVSSRQFARTDGVIDRVEALAQYGETAAHFYHGFTHSKETEQTTVALTFERGHIKLHEWVPTVLELTTDVPSDEFAALLPPVSGQTPDGALTRHMIKLDSKSQIYRESIQAGMRDLAYAVRDPHAQLAVDGTHGLASLRMAVAASR